MPARKIPLIWSSPKQKDQVVLKYNPATKQISILKCICKK